MSFINNGENEVRYGANNAALSMVFDAFNGDIIVDLGSAVSGVLPHPRSGELMYVTISQISDNRVLIKATRGNIWE